MRTKLLIGLLFLLTACQTVQFEQTAGKETAVPSPVAATLTPTPDPFAPPPRRLNAGELLLAADIDDIPAILATDALFVDAAVGSDEWPDEELVVAIELNGDARAYPIRLLSLHEIVNDTIGGQPVAITWCPLCFSAIAFDPVVDGRSLTFGVSGYLYNDNLVMYDHQTNTLWSQLAGQALRGALRGTQLRALPVIMTSWGEWKALHPDTRVLSARQMGREDTIIDPYAGYYASGAAGFSSGLTQNEALPAKSLVVGLLAGKESRAYPLPTLQSEKIINDELNKLPVLLIFDDTLQSVFAYRREVDGQTLTFALAGNGFLRDEETGSVWNGRTGQAKTGAFAGTQLSPLSAPAVFWFAWAAIHPQTDVYAGNQ